MTERLSDDQLQKITRYGDDVASYDDIVAMAIDLLTLRQEIAELRSGDDVVRDPRDPEIASVWSHAYWMERARNAERIISALNSVGPVMPETPPLEVLSAARDAYTKHGMKPVYIAIRSALARDQQGR